MRNPVRTEAEAFSFVLVAAVCFLALALAAVLGGRWVGIAVALALVLGIAVGIYIRSEPKVREPAVWERRAPDGRRRLLVLANGALAGATLLDEVAYRADEATDVLLVAPALDTSSRWSEEQDAPRGAASHRVETAVAALREQGLAVSGTVGDAAPLRAVDEALRAFAADELIVGTVPPAHVDGIDGDLVARARDRLTVPVTHVPVDLDGRPPV